MSNNIAAMTSAVIAGLACATCAEGGEMGSRLWHSNIFGKSFVTSVGKEEVRGTPAWKNVSENPPLSARRALTIADQATAKSEKLNPAWMNGKDRKLEQMTLRPCSDKWYWIIEYRWEHRELLLGSGAVPTAFVVVLMDGTVVPPEEVEDRLPGTLP